MRIKVLHFISHGRIGGQERAMYQLFRAFEHDPDFEFAVATGSEEGFYMNKILELNIPCIRLGSASSASGFKLHCNPKLIQRIGMYSIHHFHDPSPSEVFPSLLCGKKVIRLLTRRGGLINYRKYGLKKCLKFYIARYMFCTFFHGFSGNTRAALDYIDEFLRVGGQKYLLYNGIDFSLLQPREPRARVMRSMGLNNDDFHIGTACHLVKCKRVDLLIRAVQQAAIPNKKVLIFGTGAEEKNLKELVRKLGLETEVRFLGEVQNMADHLQVLDCYVQASGPEESFGNAVVEAMYLRVPAIIMSDGGGMLEHIENGQTGWVAQDERDLARKLEYIWANSDVAGSVAARASAHVQEKYSLGNMVLSYKEFYRFALTMSRKE